MYSIEHQTKRKYACKNVKNACAWRLQKIAGSVPIENVDDLHTDRYNYKKNHRCRFGKNHFFFFFFFFFDNQNVQFMKKTIQKPAISDDTCFYYSHMILSVFPRAQR